MKQKIVHLHSKVNEKGVLVELDLDEEIKKLKRDNYVVKQIASYTQLNISSNVDVRLHNMSPSLFSGAF